MILFCTYSMVCVVVEILIGDPPVTEHPNIVKFHRYWTDQGKTDEKTGISSKPRVRFLLYYTQ